MKKLTLRKVFNIIQIVLLIATLAVIFVAPYGEYKEYEWITKYDVNIGYYESEIVADYANAPIINEGVYHFFDLTEDPIQAAFLLIPTILVVLCLVLSVFSVIRKTTHRDGVLHIVLPIAAIIFFAFFVAFCIEVIGGPVFTVYSGTNPLLPVTILLGAVTILAFVKRSKSFNPETKVTVEVATNKSDAEELKKFKELLDTGVITQEEFDEKKKQLLGL